MSKKNGSKKRAPSVRGEKLYEAFSSKIEAHAIGKKVADRENKQHAPLVARVLLSFDKPVSVERIVTAAKNSGYEAKNAEHYIKGDLAFLVREGLAKATKIEAAAKPNGSLKPKRERKPRTKKLRGEGAVSNTGDGSVQAGATA